MEKITKALIITLVSIFALTLVLNILVSGFVATGTLILTIAAIMAVPAAIVFGSIFLFRSLKITK